MRGHVFRAEALAGAEHETGDETRHTGIDVNDRAASEVEYAIFTEEAAAPDPVADRCVDEQRPEDHEDEHARKLHPVSKSTGDESGRDDGESHLKGHEDAFRNGAGH